MEFMSLKILIILVIFLLLVKYQGEAAEYHRVQHIQGVDHNREKQRIWSNRTNHLDIGEYYFLQTNTFFFKSL